MKCVKMLHEGQGRTKLFCFPHAGGGASTYGTWAELIPEEVSLYAVQLPGREEHFSEQPYNDMNDVLADIITDIQPLCEEGNILFFGHSMGSKVAFLAAQQLEKQGVTLAHFMASGNAAPYRRVPNPIHQLSDSKFIKELKRFGGTPRELLENEELMQLFLPMLKADFCLDEFFYSRQGECICCPISTFAGRQDSEVSMQEVAEWKHCTHAECTLQVFEGDHFFIKTQEKMLVGAVADIIEKYS